MFCENCGKPNSNYVENNQLNNQIYQGVNPVKNNTKNIIIIGIIIWIFIISSNIGNIFINNFLNTNNYTEENKTTSILGNYSREIFSGNSFDYVPSYDSAIFTFNKDSSFTVKYYGGDTNKGTYKVYTGLYITVLASEMAKDTTIKNNVSLANNNNNIANKMMKSDILNTYLL